MWCFLLWLGMLQLSSSFILQVVCYFDSVLGVGTFAVVFVPSMVFGFMLDLCFGLAYGALWGALCFLFVV